MELNTWQSQALLSGAELDPLKLFSLKSYKERALTSQLWKLYIPSNIYSLPKSYLGVLCDDFLQLRTGCCSSFLLQKLSGSSFIPTGHNSDSAVVSLNLETIQSWPVLLLTHHPPKCFQPVPSQTNRCPADHKRGFMLPEGRVTSDG